MKEEDFSNIFLSPQRHGKSHPRTARAPKQEHICSKSVAQQKQKERGNIAKSIIAIDGREHQLKAASGLSSYLCKRIAQNGKH